MLFDPCRGLGSFLSGCPCGCSLSVFLFRRGLGSGCGAGVGVRGLACANRTPWLVQLAWKRYTCAWLGGCVRIKANSKAP